MRAQVCTGGGVVVWRQRGVVHKMVVWWSVIWRGGVVSVFMLVV